MAEFEPLNDPFEAANFLRNNDFIARPEVFLGDVVREYREFLFDLSLAGNRFPCAKRPNGSYVPMALRGAGHDFGPRWWTRESIEGIAFVDNVTAEDLFRTGLQNFLTVRAEGFNGRVTQNLHVVTLQLPNGRANVAAVAGFSVTVSASPGLRIHVSPSFRRNWSYFGDPTSPVSGVLVGGIYEFGADGGPYSSITADAGTFNIPYITTTPGLAL